MLIEAAEQWLHPRFDRRDEAPNLIGETCPACRQPFRYRTRYGASRRSSGVIYMNGRQIVHTITSHIEPDQSGKLQSVFLCDKGEGEGVQHPCN